MQTAKVDDLEFFDPDSHVGNFDSTVDCSQGSEQAEAAAGTAVRER